MTRAATRDAEIRAAARSSIITEAARVFGPTDSWDTATLNAIDNITTRVSNIAALRSFAFILANTVARN